MFQDRTTGDLIMHNYLGSIGMRTGTFTNTIAIDRYHKAESERRAQRAATPPPPPDPEPVFISCRPPVKPAPLPPCTLPSIPDDSWDIPAWKWLVSGFITGLITPLALQFLL